MQEGDLDSYMASQGLNTDQCWRSEYEVFPTSTDIYSMLRCNDATAKTLCFVHGIGTEKRKDIRNDGFMVER